MHFLWKQNDGGEAAASDVDPISAKALQSELDALLSEQPPKKRTFHNSKMQALVAALRTLDHLSRREQREAVRRLREFEQYHITDDVLREAEKRMPRKPGRKPRRPEQ